MADQDWCRFFGHDEVAFAKWYSFFRKRLISRVNHKFAVTPVDVVEEIVDEAFKVCWERPQPANLQHLQGALSLSAKNIALNWTRSKTRLEKKPPEAQEPAITARPTAQRINETDELPDNDPTPEEVVAAHDLEAFCLVEFAAVKEYLTANGDKDALKIVAVTEREGEQLKRAAMIAQTGLSAEAYDAARKRLSRAAGHKKVRGRAYQLWISSFAKQGDRGVVRSLASNGVPGDESLIDSEPANANQIVELAYGEFDREFFSRKQRE